MTDVPQPSGTVTMVFTDIEGSTKLLEQLGTADYRAALGEHRRIVRDACNRHHGYEVDYEGDAFFYAFASAQDAVSAVAEAMAGLEDGPIRIRVGIHTGSPELDPPKYVGIDVHTAARIMASGHGGQVVVSPSTAPLVETPLQELGEHRLKDIAEPIPLYQLGGESFPPLKTISNTNLPRPASSFVGRERELADVLERIEEGARLLTLTGPGGSGKTRLALEAATTLVPEYKAGVFWIGLAPLRDPALVSEHIAQTLGAKDGLHEHIGEREMLLLLDNLEQVVEAAPELSALLSACPQLTLLCTSRELLRVQGEVEYEVPPLVQPEAVALFCERSGLEATGEIAELCTRLDSLPLAVELAAARTKALTPAQILDRLSQRLDLFRGGRDADPRQQTLRATIAWSYDLLSGEEQRLFRGLSVFAGGCTLEEAEEVAEANLDGLQSLTEKSLLRFTNGRYWMLETIREYATERLEDADEAPDLRRRHAAHFVVLAEEAEPHLEGGPAQAGWLERLEEERDNLRASLAWARETDVELGLRLSAALIVFWHLRGPLAEARVWLRTLLERAGGESPELQAKVLPWVGDWAMVQGDYEEAQAFGEASLRVARQLDDPRAIGRALHDLGEVASGRGDYERARELYEQAISTASEIGYPAPGSIANLGQLALIEHDYQRAHDLFCRGLALFRDQDKPAAVAMVLVSLATVERRRGRPSEALRLVEESFELGRRLAYEDVSLYCLLELAALLVLHGDASEAARLQAASDAVLEKLGVALPPPDEETRSETLSSVEALLDDDACAEALAAGRRMSSDEAIERGLPLVREAFAEAS
jgi:predicted ATPase